MHSADIPLGHEDPLASRRHCTTRFHNRGTPTMPGTRWLAVRRQDDGHSSRDAIRQPIQERGPRRIGLEWQPDRNRPDNHFPVCVYLLSSAMCVRKDHNATRLHNWTPDEHLKESDRSASYPIPGTTLDKEQPGMLPWWPHVQNIPDNRGHCVVVLPALAIRGRREHNATRPGSCFRAGEIVVFSC